MEVPNRQGLNPTTLAMLVAAPPKARAAPQGVPGKLLPVTPKNAAAFRAAYGRALRAGEPWAKALEAEAKKKDGELNKATFLEVGQLDWTDNPGSGALDRVFKQKHDEAVARAAKAGELWAHIVSNPAATSRSSP